jgi:uncharacterized protein YcfJ
MIIGDVPIGLLNGRITQVNKFILSAAVVFFSSSAYAQDITDHYKDVIMKKPYQVEVCTDRAVSGDRSGDMIKGAILGGILGNNIKGEKDGGLAGAVIGGMLGHSNSTATGGTRRSCSVETRYEEERQRVYSHSTIVFTYQGRMHSVRFQK